MASADKLLHQVFNEHLCNLHTAMPCRVLVYYPDTLEADLQPLFRRKKGGETTDYPMIKKAPVSRTVVIYPKREGFVRCCGDEPCQCECCCCGKTVEIPEHHEKLEQGNIVFVAFAERALDHVGTRRHDLTDAVVVGRMP